MFLLRILFGLLILTLLSGCVAEYEDWLRQHRSSLQSDAAAEAPPETIEIQAEAAAASEDAPQRTQPPSAPSASTLAARQREDLREAAGLPPRLDTAMETTSTFGLDADDASWRRALTLGRQGYHLQPDEVRVEEWLQALAWEYPAPTGEEAFGLTLVATPDPFDPDAVLVLIGLSAAAAQDGPTARNVTMVLDASGSMADDHKLDTARMSARTLLDRLDTEDQVSLVQFSEVVLGEYTVAHVSPDDEALHRSLRSYTPNQSTNAAAGLLAGYDLASQAREARPAAWHYLLFVSDGVANVGATRPEAILARLGRQRAHANPIRLVSVGVGIHTYNDELLEQVANDGDGWYRYVNQPEEAESLFAQDSFVQLFTPVADEVRVQVRWDAAQVSTWQLLGYLNRAAANETFADDREDFAELHAGQETTVVYRLALKEGGTGPWGTLALRWHEPRTGVPRQLDWDLDPVLTPWEAVPAPRRLAYLVGLAAENALTVPQDAQARRQRLATELAQLGDVAYTRAGQEFAMVLEASLPPAPAWFQWESIDQE